MCGAHKAPRTVGIMGMRTTEVAAGGPSPMQSPVQSPVQDMSLHSADITVGGGPNVVVHHHHGMDTATSSINSFESAPIANAYGGGAMGGSVAQQTPVQQPPVQQLPIMYVPVVAVPATQAFGGPAIPTAPVQQAPVQQAPVQQVVQQTPIQAPPSAGVVAGADGAALISSLTSMVTTLTALVKQLATRVQQVPPADSKPATPPSTPPSSCPHNKGVTPPASTLVARFTEEIKSKTTQDDQVDLYKKYADQTNDESEKKRMFEIMIEPWSAERKEQLKRFLEAVSRNQN